MLAESKPTEHDDSSGVSEKDPFSYENINRCDGGKLFIQAGSYQVFQSVYFEEDFIFLKNLKPTSTMVPAMKNQWRGYKLHIAIDDAKEDDNFQKGWIVVKNILIEYRIYFFKVIKNSSRADVRLKLAERGFITIYAFKESRTDWQEIIDALTKALTTNGIRSGALAQQDIGIPGSDYVGYCNDGNPAMENPFQNLKI